MQVRAASNRLAVTFIGFQFVDLQTKASFSSLASFAYFEGHCSLFRLMGSKIS